MTRIITYDKNCTSIEKLAKSDNKLAALITTIGDYHLDLRTDLFQSLLRSIIGQQLSVKAAQTIWQRTVQLLEKIDAEVLLNADEGLLRSAGISGSKIKYLKDLSEKVLTEQIILGNLYNLEDEEVILTLTKVKGIGLWTAEMFLIFSLGRQNVLSLGDAGLKRAIRWLYDLDSFPGPAEMLCLGEQWQPYRTVASLYLWEAINRNLCKAPLKH